MGIFTNLNNFLNGLEPDESPKSKEANNSKPTSYNEERYYSIDASSREKVKEYKEAAKRGEVDGYYNLARCYESGCGVPQSYKLAIDYYKLAADKGHLDAKAEYAWLCYDGSREDKIKAYAVETLKEAADQNNARAQCYLGIIYIESIRMLPEFYNEAYNYYHTLSMKGDLLANTFVKVLLENNLGQTLRSVSDWKYQLHAIEGAGFKENYCELVTFMPNPYNYTVAVKYLEAAAKQNNDKAHYVLGRLYRIGLGVECNYEKALEHYKIAAESKNIDALIALSCWYKEGHGIERDLEQAAKYAKMATEISDTDDMRLLLDRCLKPAKAAKNENLVIYVKGVGIELVKCHKGTFVMGSPLYENGRDKNENQHRVVISKDFYIGKYPVTKLLFESVMHYPHKNINEYVPITGFNRYVIDEFILKLNKETENTRPEGYEFTLPTEAQWEYACRAGSTATLFNGKNIYRNFSDDVNDLIYDNKFLQKHSKAFAMAALDYRTYRNFKSNEITDAQKRIAVCDCNGDTPWITGLKEPNNWGIYDMLGNVEEWCGDEYGDYPSLFAIDPVYKPHKYIHYEFRKFVCRGGSFHSWRTSEIRCAYRNQEQGDLSSPYLGFRVVLTVKEKDKQE